MSVHLKDEWEKLVVEQLSRPHLKDFAKLKTNLERFKFCRNILRSDPEALDIIDSVHDLLHKRAESSSKSAEKALHLTLAGDQAFAKSQFRRALSFYSRAVQYIPCLNSCADVSYCGGTLELNGIVEDHSISSQLSLATILTKRAEVLFLVGEFEACLNDIEEASSLHYNHVISDKLLKVQRACLRKQARQGQSSHGSSSSIPNLSGGEHPKIANGSSLLKINYDTHQGRYLQASGEIRAGDALISEEPYSAVLLLENAETHCECCYKRLVAPYPCQQCSVLYCSVACRDKAWAHYHCVDCSIFPVLEMVDTFTHLSLRILLTAGAETIIDVLSELSHNTTPMDCTVPGCTQDGSYPGDYGSVFSLVTNSDLQPVKALMSYALNSAFLVEFLGDTLTRPYLQRLSSSDSGLGKSLTSQPVLDSDDDSVASDEICDACVQERSKCELAGNACSVHEINRTSCSGAVCKNAPRSQQAYASLGLSCGELTNCERLSDDVVGSLLLHHLQQMPCNVHAITAIVSTSSSDEEGEDDEMGGQEQVISREQRRIATAIYPTASLLNHACDPDVIVSFVNGSLVVRATHNIAPGSEITHCYGPHVSRMPREERQKLLYKQYFFTCQCSACRSDEELENKRLCFSAFACPNCKSPLKPSLIDSVMAKCQNKNCAMEKCLEEELRQARGADLLFFKGIRTMERVGVQEAIEVLKQCLRTRKQILHRYHKDLAETHDAIARCYAMIGDFKLATHHCLQSSEAVEKAFGSSSVEYGHELHKLSQLLFNDRQVKKALAIIDKAIGLLATYYGRCHPDVEELGEMKKCLAAVGGPRDLFL